MKLALVGIGLIGGSIGLAARRRQGGMPGIEVVGYDPSEQVRTAARAAGAVDRVAASVEEAVQGADAVFVACPIAAIPEAVQAVLGAAGEDCVVSDVGSTKRGIVAAVQDPRFVGGHPLAGAESGGVQHARPGLFDGATWYLVPSREARQEHLARLREVIEWLGAHPQEIDPASHDRLMAHVSHLPHVFANVLVSGLAASVGGEDGPATGPSFRDATRVAGANTAIWTDIYLSNSALLVEAIDDAVRRLQQVRDALASGDRDGLAAWNEAARAERERLLAAAGRSGA